MKSESGMYAVTGRIIASVILTITLSSCSQPVADFHDTDGIGYRYEDFTGKWMVINYWATWCAPCIKEIPELIALDERHDNVVVFGVNYDAPEGDEIAKQIDRMKISFPVYANDPSMELGADIPVVLPTTLLIDPEGVLSDVLVGPQTEATLLAAMGL
jgi:thiol-disulfide isomerase/thioredoxin